MGEHTYHQKSCYYTAHEVTNTICDIIDMRKELPNTTQKIMKSHET